MKRFIIPAVALVLVAVLLAGCTGFYDKSPDEYDSVCWINSDYNIRFFPDEGCTGRYHFNGHSYNIQVRFDSTRVNVLDSDKNDALLFSGDWMYDENGFLYIYGISYNKNDYAEFKKNFVEFYTLRPVPLDELKKSK